MAHRHADGMESAEAAAMGDEGGPVLGILGEGDDLIDDVLLVVEMSDETLLWRDVEVVEIFAIEAIDADNLNLAGLDAMAERVDHAVILVLEETLFAGGEYEETLTALSEDEEFHVPLEGGAVPFVVLAVHGDGGRRVGGCQWKRRFK